MAVHGNNQSSRTLDFSHLMHQRGIEIMRSHPHVLSAPFTQPIWAMLIPHIVKDYIDQDARKMPNEGKIDYNGKTIYWTIQDSDRAWSDSGFYFFFEDIDTQMLFRLRF